MCGVHARAHFSHLGCSTGIDLTIPQFVLDGKVKSCNGLECGLLAGGVETRENKCKVAQLKIFISPMLITVIDRFTYD